MAEDHNSTRSNITTSIDASNTIEVKIKISPKDSSLLEKLNILEEEFSKYYNNSNKKLEEKAKKLIDQLKKNL